MGRMQACGQTMEQLPHWMHLSIFHSGTVTAMPRFSNLVVPVGTQPEGSNALTGRLSPSWARMGSTKVRKYSVDCTFTGSAPVVALAQLSGTSILTRPEMAISIITVLCLSCVGLWEGPSRRRAFQTVRPREGPGGHSASGVMESR